MDGDTIAEKLPKLVSRRHSRKVIRVLKLLQGIITANLQLFWISADSLSDAFRDDPHDSRALRLDLTPVLIIVIRGKGGTPPLFVMDVSEGICHTKNR